MEVLVDVHCHILPGVDDGAKSMEEALELLKTQAQQGVRKIILTPHYREGYFETSREEIREVYQRVCRMVDRKRIPVECYLGCEFHRNADILQFLERDSAYCMAETRYVLLEFSESDAFRTIRNYTSGLLNNGYRPILAHVERYQELDESSISELTDLGACIQVNAESVLGKNGWRNKRFSHKLIKEDLVHFIGSDTHNLKKRPPYLGACAAYMNKKFGTAQTSRILSENPQKLLQNEYI